MQNYNVNVLNESGTMFVEMHRTTDYTMAKIYAGQLALEGSTVNITAGTGGVVDDSNKVEKNAKRWANLSL